MRETFRPRLEFYWPPAIWGAATLVVLTTVSIFLFQQPGWMLPSALVAGMVTAARSGFYDPSGNNAFVGMLLGMAGLLPVFIVRRYLEYSAMMETTGDVVFMIGTQLVADIMIALLFLPVFGYIGASLFDIGRGHLPLGRLKRLGRRG